MNFKLTKVIAVLLVCLSMSGFTYIENQPIRPKTSILIDNQSYVSAPLIITNYYDLENFSLTEPSNLTPEQLAQGLRGSLKNYAPVYIEMEQTYGINAVFLAAKDALESGWGEYTYGNNLSGWGNRSFSSHEECIREVSFCMKQWYLTPPHESNECDENCEYDQFDNCLIGQYFNGYTISDVNICYNGRQEWEDRVKGIMIDIYEKIDIN